MVGRWHLQRSRYQAGRRAALDDLALRAVRARLAVVGDVGRGTRAREAVATAMAKAHQSRPFDALVLLGDLVYPDGNPALVDATVREPYRDLLADGVPLLAVLGDHDVDRGRGDEIATLLDMPARWYATEIGPLQVVALDSTQPRSRRQRSWLRHTLSRRHDGPRIVILHHAPYSGGWHGPDRGARRWLVPIVRRRAIDLVLAGHDHDYQRTEPIDGTVYLVSGGGCELRPTGRASYTAHAESRYHFLDLWVYDDRIDVRPTDPDGVVFDRSSVAVHHPTIDLREGADLDVRLADYDQASENLPWAPARGGAEQYWPE